MTDLISVAFDHEAKIQNIDERSVVFLIPARNEPAFIKTLHAASEVILSVEQISEFNTIVEIEHIK